MKVLNFFRKEQPVDPVEPMPYNQIKFNKQMIAINRICTELMKSGELGDKEHVIVPVSELWKIRDIANHARQFTPIEE